MDEKKRRELVRGYLRGTVGLSDARFIPLLTHDPFAHDRFYYACMHNVQGDMEAGGYHAFDALTSWTVVMGFALADAQGSYAPKTYMYVMHLKKDSPHIPSYINLVHTMQREVIFAPFVYEVIGVDYRHGVKCAYISFHSIGKLIAPR